MRKGLIHVYTGDGKGKTTAALGLALRAAGQGLKVIIIQFLKGDPNCGEHLFASKYHPFEIVQFTSGNCFTLPEEQLRKDVDKTFAFTEETINSGNYQMVILDEIFVAFNRKLLESSQIIELIRRKPDSVELVLTGRKAPPEIIDLADYVTEMQMIKHPYTNGIKGRKGIEF
jgi:cob(I)alamin adenosyltransferase